MLRQAYWVATIVCALAFAVAVSAADAPYPTKTIRIISPFDPGGTSDLSVRVIADIAKDMLKVPIIVENRPGGGGTVGIGQVTKLPPDGYTLVQFTSSPVVIRPPQGAAHLSTEALFRSANVKTTFVPTGGGAEAILQLLGGQIEAASVTDFAGPMAEGKIRLLAESGPVRVATAPAVPTYKELGHPLSLAVYIGLAGPAGLPDNVVKTWDETLKRVVEHPRFTEFLRVQNASPYYANSADLTRDIRQEIAELRSTLQQMGMTKPDK
jgi:tripartite-type tricarboxylate transporter receptor subunit TctC